MQSVNSVSSYNSYSSSSVPLSTQVINKSEGNGVYSPEEVNGAVKQAEDRVNEAQQVQSDKQDNVRGLAASNYAQESKVNQIENYYRSATGESVEVQSGASNQAIVDFADGLQNRERPEFGARPERPEAEPYPEQPIAEPVSAEQASLQASYQSASQPIPPANLDVIV